MTNRAAFLSIMMLGGIGPIDCRETPTQPAAQRAKPVDMATAPQAPKAPEPPLDGQIMRDAVPSLAQWRQMDMAVRKPMIMKRLDEYEKDRCHAEVVGDARGGGMVDIGLTYRWQGSFWKLADRSSNIFPNDSVKRLMARLAKKQSPLPREPEEGKGSASAGGAN